MDALLFGSFVVSSLSFWFLQSCIVYFCRFSCKDRPPSDYAQAAALIQDQVMMIMDIKLMAAHICLIQDHMMRILKCDDCQLSIGCPEPCSFSILGRFNSTKFISISGLCSFSSLASLAASHPISLFCCNRFLLLWNLFCKTSTQLQREEVFQQVSSHKQWDGSTCVSTFPKEDKLQSSWDICSVVYMFV